MKVVTMIRKVTRKNAKKTRKQLKNNNPGSMQRPLIRTRLPGPNAKNILNKDHKYVSPSYTRGYPAVIDSGKGVWVTDVDGNIFWIFPRVLVWFQPDTVTRTS